MEGTGDKSRNNLGVSLSDNFSNLNDREKYFQDRGFQTSRLAVFHGLSKS